MLCHVVYPCMVPLFFNHLEQLIAGLHMTVNLFIFAANSSDIEY